MNSLDSRFLRPGNTFAQSFTQPGLYTYDFGLPIPNRRGEAGGPFTIRVKEDGDRRSDGAQHNVRVKRECGRLKADPEELEIEAGDVVLWYSLDPSMPGFTVGGHSETDFFSSAALTREALYTHAFGTAGDFQWKDANGSRVSGKVLVTMPQTRTARDMESYKERLAEGAMVVISGERAEPAQVEIVVGQTVCFVVEQADGITITDTKLLTEAASPQHPTR